MIPGVIKKPEKDLLQLTSPSPHEAVRPVPAADSAVPVLIPALGSCGPALVLARYLSA